jgi:uncharacterized protein (DUF2252 family)
MASAYQDAFVNQGGREPAPKCVRWALQAAYRRNWEKLAQDRVDRPKWYFPRGRRFWDLSEPERNEIEQLFGDKDLLSVIFGEEIGDIANCQIEDAAFWVKGCSSLGLSRLAVLLRHTACGPTGWRLIDIKEAVAPKAPVVEEALLRDGEAGRVVSAARVLAPNLGARMAARRLMGRSVFIRELLPQDLKLEINSLTPQQAIKAARYLAATLGRALGERGAVSNVFTIVCSGRYRATSYADARPPEVRVGSTSVQWQMSRSTAGNYTRLAQGSKQGGPGRGGGRVAGGSEKRAVKAH